MKTSDVSPPANQISPHPEDLDGIIRLIAELLVEKKLSEIDFDRGGNSEQLAN